MNYPKNFPINPFARIILRDLGISTANVCRRAGLPEDLFSREGASVTTQEYFAMWRALEEESKDPLLPLKIGSAISAESFSPPIFAAMCSPNLDIALERLARHKRLVCPVALLVSKSEQSTSIEIKWMDSSQNPPASLAAMDLVFFVQLARLASRERIIPLKVTAPQASLSTDDYTEYFGVRVRQENLHSLTFSAEDAARPFLTANEGMWQYFEPLLRKRLHELDEQATISERVRAILLEMLPSGRASLSAVSAKLGLSSRTLHRRLSQESLSFQSLLNQTREDLAKHYLGNSSMSGAEISFLLGYEDPNSFLRAFQQWTGKTPQQAREAMRQ